MDLSPKFILTDSNQPLPCACPTQGLHRVSVFFNYSVLWGSVSFFLIRRADGPSNCACATRHVLMGVSAGVLRRGVPSSRKCKIKHGGPLCERFCAVPWTNCPVSKEGHVTFEKKKNRLAFEMLELARTWNFVSVRSYVSTADVCESCRGALHVDIYKRTRQTFDPGDHVSVDLNMLETKHGTQR